MNKGKFIVLYGINNLGKTTQAKRLVDRLNASGEKAEYLKYPIYSLEPAGKLINEYLRQDNPHQFSPREAQLLHYIDRVTFEPELKKKLEAGTHIIAEDYFGTAIAWGVGAGVDEKLLEYLYTFLYKEDLAILFDGERFRQSIEKSHKHENDEKLITTVRDTHRRLQEKYGWELVNANLSIEEIHAILWKKVSAIL